MSNNPPNFGHYYVNFRQASAGVSFNLEPEQAVAFFQAKGLKPTFAWDEMLTDEHTRAFTVAKMMDADMLGDVRKLVDQAISEGKSLGWFREELTPYLQARGWWGKKDVITPGGKLATVQLGSPARLETIFRNNMQSAYATGQWDQIIEQAELYPFLMYDALDDGRTRPEHARWDETVLPVNSPWWRTHYPPNGWNCRCGVIQVDDAELAAMGKSGPDEIPPGKTYTWTSPSTGKKYRIPDGIDPGWQYNPGTAYQATLDQLLAEKILRLPPDMQASAKAGLAATAAQAEKAKVAAAVSRAAKNIAKAEGAAALERSTAAVKQRAALFNAKDELAKIEATNPPYLGTALAQVKKTAAWDTWDDIERLAAVHARALKNEEGIALAQYKKAVIAGKQPAPKAVATFEAQSQEIQDAITEQITAKKTEVAAAKKLEEVLANPDEYGLLGKYVAEMTAAGSKLPAAELLGEAGAKAYVQGSKLVEKYKLGGAGLKNEAKAYAQLLEEGKLAQKMPWEVVKLVDARVVELKAQATKAVLLSKFKKKILADKVPSPGEASAFHSLSAEEQSAFLAKIDQAKAKAAAAQLADDAPPPPVEPPAPPKAAPGTKPAPPPVQEPPATPPAAEDIVSPPPRGPDPANFIQVGPQKGSNPGGLFQDSETGQKFYVKYLDEDVARNELLAAKLYAEAGIDAPELFLVKHDGRVGLASKYVEGLTKSKAKITSGKVAGVADGFVTDAWLANWDVVGLEYDNLLVAGNKAFRVDVGGALRYRAQGGLKPDFGGTVAELESLLNAGTNSRTASVFGKFDKKALDAGALRVMNISDTRIRQVVKLYGPQDQATADKLAETLIARKQFIAKRYQDLAVEYQAARKAAIAEAKADVKGAVQEIDGKITTAIKGINVRASKDLPLEQKDLDRVKAAREELEAFIQLQGPKLTKAGEDEIRAYYETWLEALEEAVRPGAGAKATWEHGWFSPYSNPIRIAEERVKVELYFGDGSTRYTAKKGNEILKANGITPSSYNREGTGAFKNLDPHHVGAIRAYTGKHYGDFNRDLRSPGTTKRATREYESLLNQALAYAQKYTGESTRGIRLHGDDYTKFMAGVRQAHENGDLWSDKGFMSSTKGPRPAFDGNVWLHFQGRTGVYVKPISMHPSENEVLIGTQAKFVVDDITVDGTRTHIYFTEAAE